MELDLDVYNRLVNYGILESTMSNKVYNDSKKAVLDKQSTAFFENGVAIGRYLLVVKKLMELEGKPGSEPNDDKSVETQPTPIKSQTDLKSIESMKSGMSASARLYNWNILIKELDKIGIEVDQDTKSLIIAGDTEFIYEVLFQLYNFELHIKDEPKKINK